MPNESSQILPLKPTPWNITLKMVAGIAGGLLGGLIIVAIFLLSSSILQAPFQGEFEQGQLHSLFVFLFMAMIFLGVTVASLVTAWLSALSSSERYTHVNSALYQIFIFNIFFLVVAAPIYVVFARFGMSTLIYITVLHVIISAISGVCILEIMANTPYGLLGIYSGIFGVLLGTTMNVMIFKLSGGMMTFVLLSGIPIVWFSIGLLNAFIALLYHWLYRLYGIDFLRIDTNYGADVASEDERTTEEIEEETLKEKKDETGSEFLQSRGNKK
ncbi:hypothetical protein HYV57_05985 [Candidatus Peregrinibacteria bacterium]|nr:hypothetical protein [Candidatus Peregrinibacteria bacterium]